MKHRMKIKISHWIEHVTHCHFPRVDGWRKHRHIIPPVPFLTCSGSHEKAKAKVISHFKNYKWLECSQEGRAGYVFFMEKIIIVGRFPIANYLDLKRSHPEDKLRRACWRKIPACGNPKWPRRFKLFFFFFFQTTAVGWQLIGGWW